MDLGDEEIVAELKKAVKAGLLGAGELKAQEDMFKKANGGDGVQPVASTSGTRRDDDDGSSVKSKKAPKKDEEDEPAPEGKGKGKKRSSR